jgi:Domain of unknown function (DUF4360)
MGDVCTRPECVLSVHGYAPKRSLPGRDYSLLLTTSDPFCYPKTIIKSETRNVMNTITPFNTIACTLCALSLSATGCVNADVDAASPSEELQTSSEALTVPNPNGSYFASVTANGTGCPVGSWDASIAADGQTFTVRFSAYEASVNPGILLSVKDCQLAINLHSPQGLSYSVGEIFYSGYAFLDRAGMTGRQTAKYYFQGNPVASSDGRSTLTGPKDDAYTFNDNVGIADLVWSKCGVDRNLNVQTRLTLQNDAAKSGTGYLNTSAVDGSISLKFRLFWKTC